MIDAKKKILNIHVIVTVIFILLSFSIFLFRFTQTSDLTNLSNTKENNFYRIDSEIEAGSAIIYDLNSEIIIAAKNPYKLKSIASITKLTSAFVSFSFFSDTDTTTISDSDFDVGGYTELYLGDKWRTRDLLEYSLITSSNVGINAVGRTLKEKTGLFILDFMNNFARNNGLVQTHFVNSTGLDAHTNLSGSESSALDLAKLSSIILNKSSDLAKSTIVVKEDFYSVEGKKYVANNTNILLSKNLGNVLLSKTGYTDLAGGTLIMVVEKESGPVSFVVLGSTRSGRFKDMEILLDLYDKNRSLGLHN